MVASNGCSRDLLAVLFLSTLKAPAWFGDPGHCPFWGPRHGCVTVSVLWACAQDAGAEQLSAHRGKSAARGNLQAASPKIYH